jgi:hypothetical protein
LTASRRFRGISPTAAARMPPALMAIADELIE